MSAAFRVAFNDGMEIRFRQQMASKLSEDRGTEFIDEFNSLKVYGGDYDFDLEFFSYLVEDWKSGRGPARISAAFNAEVSILAGGLEFYAGGVTAGATGGTLLAFGAANVSEGVSNYMNIFDNGNRDYNAIRVGLQSVYGEQNGANIFYGIDLGLGSAGIFNFNNAGVSLYTTSGVTLARDAFLLNSTVESIDND
jgi:hypothetical protein